jgi:hypothetical protein
MFQKENEVLRRNGSIKNNGKLLHNSKYIIWKKRKEVENKYTRQIYRVMEGKILKNVGVLIKKTAWRPVSYGAELAPHKLP